MKPTRRSLFSKGYNFLNPAYWLGDVDARPVALFRIAFGALMVKEALYHLALAGTFYSDQGIVSRSVLTQTPWVGGFSLMGDLPETWMALLFFILWGLIALGMMLGYRTRLLTVLNFICLLSTNNRNPILVSGAEMVMNALAFWSMFIPLGAAYSLDARRVGRSYTQKPMIYAFPVRMLQLQVAIIYIMTTVIKLQGQSWPGGDALYLALQARLYVFPTGDWLLTHAPLEVLRALTSFTLLVEGGFALLVFAPFLQPYLRGIGLLSGIALHIGIGLMMAIPNFPLVMLCSYLAFLDPRWINWGEGQITRILKSLPPSLPAAGDPSEPSGCGGLIANIISAVGQGGYRAALAGLLTFAMICIIWMNILNNDRLSTEWNVNPMPSGLQNMVGSLGLSQSWSLFAPDPLGLDTWFILAGQMKGGQRIDLRTGESPGTARPRWWVGPWARWEKFEENLSRVETYSPLWVSWGAYLCREYQDLESLEIILRSQKTVLPGQPFPAQQDQIMWSGSCNRENPG